MLSKEVPKWKWRERRTKPGFPRAGAHELTGVNEFPRPPPRHHIERNPPPARKRGAITEPLPPSSAHEGPVSSPKQKGGISKGSPKTRRVVELKDTLGPCPGERYGHTAVLDETGGGIVVIFGGCDSSGTFSQQLYHYNIETCTWSLHDGEGAPPGRHFHSAVFYDDSMYIFGGTSNGYYNDLFQYHIDSQTWTLISPANSPPSARYGHSAVVFGGSMYIFGGFDVSGFPTHELYKYDFEKCLWTQLPPKGVRPKDRYHHSAVVYQGSLYVFGGSQCYIELMEYRFGTGTWSLVDTNGIPPPPRWGHRSVVVEGAMYVFGGRDSVGTFSDLYEFRFDSLTWKRTSLDTSVVSPRAFHSMVSYSTSMLMFGGMNIFNYSFDELYELQLGGGSDIPVDTLSADLRALVNNPFRSDVTFVFPSEDNLVIFAHRNVLAVRCEPMRAMLCHGYKESIAGRIRITNVRHAIFYALVEYLYTGQVSSDPDECVELFEAGEQYQLAHLKSLCEQKISNYIGLDNAATLYIWAIKYKSALLKRQCKGYIQKNYDPIKRDGKYKAMKPGDKALIEAVLDGEFSESSEYCEVGKT